jgi:hypothetical protein
MSLKEILSSVQNSFQFRKLIEARGVKYELSVLSVDQEKKVNGTAANQEGVEGIEYFNQLKKELLCEAIVSINGEKLDKTVKVPGADGKEVEKDKAIFLREVLGDFPTALIDQLFEAYLDIKEQSEDVLKKEMRYDWFKTPEQRKKEYEEKVKEESKIKEEVKPVSEEKDVSFKKIEEPKEAEKLA